MNKKKMIQLVRHPKRDRTERNMDRKIREDKQKEKTCKQRKKKEEQSDTS